MARNNAVNAPVADNSSKFHMKVLDNGEIKMTFTNPKMGSKSDGYMISDADGGPYLKINGKQVIVADDRQSLTNDPDILLKCNNAAVKPCVEVGEDGQYHTMVVCESTLL